MQVFTIEPMINMGTYRDMLWPDGWTAVTTDGGRSAQFEHQIVITKDGAEVLTARTPDSPLLWWELEQQQQQQPPSSTDGSQQAPEQQQAAPG